MNLRKYAQGKPCMIRLPGCTGIAEETVLCHYRDSSTGMGQKENDLIGAWGCSHCHDVVDGRRNYEWIDPAGTGHAFLQAIIRTQQQLIRDGVFKIK